MYFYKIITYTKKHEDLFTILKHRDSRIGLLRIINSQWKLFCHKFYLHPYEKTYLIFWLNIIYLSNLDLISEIITNIEKNKLVVFNLLNYTFKDISLNSILSTIKNNKHKQILNNIIQNYIKLISNIISKMNVIGRAYKTYKFRKNLYLFLFKSILLKNLLIQNNLQTIQSDLICSNCN